MYFWADIEVFVGSPAIEVSKEVIRRGHDLVTKTAKVDSTLERMFFGDIE